MSIGYNPYLAGRRMLYRGLYELYAQCFIPDAKVYVGRNDFIKINS
jgi:hypothetical protein